VSAVSLDGNAVRAERLARHGLTRPVEDEAGYLDLFSRLQPVSPQANSYPGSPPRLMHRTSGCADDELADELRGQRQLVKGRFQGGTVATSGLMNWPCTRRPIAVPWPGWTSGRKP
jgi:hypothetical protein|tara:strand:- start:1093 stop:1440 length:348 start_codon:yes stop_codon:yes gene_type:complete